MIYGLLAKFFIGGGFLMYLYSLYYRYLQMAEKNAQDKAQATIKNDLDKIAEDAKNVKETDRDYSSAIDKFNNDNKPS